MKLAISKLSINRSSKEFRPGFSRNPRNRVNELEDGRSFLTIGCFSFFHWIGVADRQIFKNLIIKLFFLSRKVGESSRENKAYILPWEITREYCKFQESTLSERMLPIQDLHSFSDSLLWISSFPLF